VRRAAALDVADVVSLPGFLPQSDMPQFFGAIDLLAHPSFEEPFGLVVVEAMACARPVVAINGGGIPEIIRHGRDGLLVPAEDAAALANAMCTLIENPGQAQELTRSARQRVVESFSPEIQAAAMAQVYERVLDSSN
jgi:glycosyltransferase involved in cell wall biosynthesis